MALCTAHNCLFIGGDLTIHFSCHILHLLRAVGVFLVISLPKGSSIDITNFNLEQYLLQIVGNPMETTTKPQAEGEFRWGMEKEDEAQGLSHCV